MINITQELDRIYQANGCLTPQLVVDDARPAGSPLHDRFEWDDNVAGEKYRLTQAARLIRTCRIIRENPEGRKQTLRAYLPVADPQQRSTAYEYKPVDEIMEDPVSRRLILAQMDRDWRRFRARYEKYAEYASLIEDEHERLEQEHKI